MLTDVTNTGALLSIQEVTAKFELTKELASMTSFCGTTIGKNIFKEVDKTLVQDNLKWNLIRWVTTDGGKNVCRKENLLLIQTYKAYENVRCSRLMVYLSVVT